MSTSDNTQTTSESTSTYLPVLTTDRLILIPAPLLTASASYITFFSTLLSDRSFHDNAFGKWLEYKVYTQSDVETLMRRKVDVTWARRGFGDFGVALKKPDHHQLDSSSQSQSPDNNNTHYWAEHSVNYLEEAGIDIESLTWIGYGCIRDMSPAVTRSRTERDGASAKPVGDWQEMVEMKYGLAPEFWGQRLAPTIVNSLHAWGSSKLGVRRFVASTITSNTRSAAVLKRAGYIEEELDISPPEVAEALTEWAYRPPTSSSEAFAVPQGQEELGWKY